MFVIKSVKTKILSLCISAVVLTILALLCIVSLQKNVLRDDVNVELDALGRNETQKIAQSVYKMCEAQNAVFVEVLRTSMQLASSLYDETSGIAFAEGTTTWNGIDPITNTPRQISLPQMYLDGVLMTPATNADETTNAFADRVGLLSGGICSVFQRMNSAGDMLRVSTNVRNADGSRAIGTFISATQADGSANPIIGAVLRGQTFEGRAKVLGTWHLASYKPLYDQNKNVVGVLAIAVKQSTFEKLRQSIMDIVVGQTGYVFVVGGKGDQKGVYLISKDGERDGENIWEAQDANGSKFIQSVVGKALKTENGSVDFETYPWKNTGETIARNKVAAVTYFEPWDWVIGSGTYEDDFRQAQERVSASLNRMMFYTLIGGLILFFVFGALATLVSSRIANPLRRATQVAEAVAQGDLTQTLDIKQADEVGQLAIALNLMEDRLNELIGSIQASAVQVSTASEELSSSSQILSSGATEQAASLEETSASIEELTASIQSNSENANTATRSATQCSEKAEKGGQSVLATVDAMKRIAEQITVIDDIADQTNLLALNAAIEAARAGEMGKGFAVVAVEVRKLAERSQSAAQEISELARNSVSGAEEAGRLIQEVVPEIQDTASLVQEINSACEEQAAGASQISQAVTQLDQVTQQNASTSEESAAASEELSAQAQAMQEQVSMFKIRAAVGHNGRPAKPASLHHDFHAPHKMLPDNTHFGPNDSIDHME